MQDGRRYTSKHEKILQKIKDIKKKRRKEAEARDIEKGRAYVLAEKFKGVSLMQIKLNTASNGSMAFRAGVNSAVEDFEYRG